MTGSSRYPPGFGAPAPGSSPPPASNGPGYVPKPPVFDSNVGRSPNRTGLLAAGVVLALLLGIAALVVAIVAAVPRSEPAPASPVQAEPQQLFVDDADRALCQAIAPLMRESTDAKNAFIRSGPPGSPERDAAISTFKSDTEDWSHRAQELINGHANPPRYLIRTLQRYVDDMLLYVENIYPGQPPDEFDQPTWQLGIVDYGGPLSVCARLGIEW